MLERKNEQGKEMEPENGDGRSDATSYRTSFKGCLGAKDQMERGVGPTKIRGKSVRMEGRTGVAVLRLDKSDGLQRLLGGRDRNRGRPAPMVRGSQMIERRLVSTSNVIGSRWYPVAR